MSTMMTIIIVDSFSTVNICSPGEFEYFMV